MGEVRPRTARRGATANRGVNGRAGRAAGAARGSFPRAWSEKAATRGGIAGARGSIQNARRVVDLPRGACARGLVEQAAPRAAAMRGPGGAGRTAAAGEVSLRAECRAPREAERLGDLEALERRPLRPPLRLGAASGKGRRYLLTPRDLDDDSDPDVFTAPDTLTENYLSWYSLRFLGIDVTDPANFSVARTFYWDGTVLAEGDAASTDLSPTRIRRFYQSRALMANRAIVERKMMYRRWWKSLALHPFHGIPIDDRDLLLMELRRLRPNSLADGFIIGGRFHVPIRANRLRLLADGLGYTVLLGDH